MTSGSSTDRVLLDAHTLLWWLDGGERLSEAATVAIAGASFAATGAGTIAELAVKASIGKLRLPARWTERARDRGFEVLPFDWPHADRLSSLPFVRVNGREHRDPFDRMLVAQSLTDGLPIVTRDPAIGAYGCGVIW